MTELLYKLLLNKYKKGGGKPSGDYNAKIATKTTGTTLNLGNLIITLPELDTSSITSMQSAFAGFLNLTTISQINTSNVTNMSSMFNNCPNLSTIPQFDTSKVTNMQSMFVGCSSLTSLPQFNTSSVTNMSNMFSLCTNLVTVPQFDTSKVTTMFNIAGDCPNLSNESLNNILAMCINAVNYTSTKTLSALGLTHAYYPVSRIQALSNYEAFLNAGWTIGY